MQDPARPPRHDLSLEAVILDVDGTLVDSERDGHRVAFNIAFEEFGLPWRWDVEEYGRLLAVTGGQTRLHAYLESQGVAEEQRADLVPRLHRRKTEVFLELVAAGKVEARPGVREFLDEVSAAGLRLAVATTGSLAWVEPLLERHFGRDRFEVVVGGDDVKATKPDPAAYLIALERLGLEARDTVAVEDSVPGLGAARAAGVPCVVVVNDYTRGQDFSGAALVVDGFADLDVATLRRLTEPPAG
ncbi:MAG: HAD-IA family hydrolase [Acidimicrobiia bacterium]